MNLISNWKFYLGLAVLAVFLLIIIVPAEDEKETSFGEIALSEFVEAADEVDLDLDDGVLHVEFMPQQWSYGAVAPLNPAGLKKGPALLIIKLQVISGEVGVGILNKSQKAFLVRKSLLPEDRLQCLILPVSEVSKVSDLVFCSHAPDGQTSQAEIHSVELIPSRLASDAESVIKAWVASQAPEILTPNATEWEKVRWITDWGYRNILKSVGIGYLIDCYGTPDFYQMGAPEHIARLLKHEGGVICGGKAEIMRKVFRIFGFEAYAINSGQRKGRSSHVFNLVKVKHEGRDILAMLDAHFNLAYIHPDGEPMDYFDCLKLLCQGRHSEIKTIRGRFNQATVVFKKDEIPALPTDTHCYSLEVFNNLRQVAGSPLVAAELNYSLQTFWACKLNRQRYIAYLRSLGMPDDIKYILLAPLGISEGGDEIYKKAQRMLNDSSACEMRRKVNYQKMSPRVDSANK
jgi:hypothetical protein